METYMFAASPSTGLAVRSATVPVASVASCSNRNVNGKTVTHSLRRGQRSGFCPSLQPLRAAAGTLAPMASRSRLTVLGQARKPETRVNAALAEAQLDEDVFVPNDGDALSEYVAAHGGRRVIRKILVANNGMAAAKCIMSMRRWCYLNFGDESLIRFVVMATPEDLGANAEFIRQADDYVEVPGGKNSNNYANVPLIVNIARNEGVDAVWPGWGHASENPRLPASLKECGIQFIGPTSPVMSVLGDKIAANILAQTAQVPSIPWSGDGLVATLNDEGTIPMETFNKATVTSEEEAVETAERVGYPIMIKASEGGGGKGIRMVSDPEKLAMAYQQVTSEVPGSPVFMMQLCSEARHLEVQIVGDEHGNAVALNGRDCSTQRRFQKIFEEGPPTVAPTDIFDQMEKAAQRLTQNIGYIGAGTVEYLFNAATNKYYFLELNPRLQVEHPVTEGITGVNLPATQLQVAMGIPLDRMPDIRRFYGRDEDGDSAIDFMTDEYVYPNRHVIAARITAENPDEGFKPTSGKIDRIRFQSSPNVWGYFSVGNNGAVHEFADSQFGHLFAFGADREEARKALSLALKELLVRGEIRTAVEYLEQLLDTEEFKDNTIDTSWLDGIIASKGLDANLQAHLIVASAAITRAFAMFNAERANIEAALSKGQQPAASTLAAARSVSVEVTYDSTKYGFTATMLAEDEYRFMCNGQTFTARVRQQSDGTLLAVYGGETHRLSAQEEPLGLRLEIDGKTMLIPTQFDPSELRSDVTGKVVRFLHEDGAQVEAGQPYIELEAMKMVMPLMATESGVINHRVSPGGIVEAGELLANLQLRDPSRVKKILPFTGTFDFVDEDQSEMFADKLAELDACVEAVDQILAGYAGEVEPTVQRLVAVLTNQKLFKESLDEAMKNVSEDALPAGLQEKIASGAITQGPELYEEIYKDTFSKIADKFRASAGPVDTVAKQYKEGRWGRTIGVFADIVQKFVAVESQFAGRAYDAAVRRVRGQAPSLSDATDVVLSHAALARRTQLVKSILNQLQTLPQRCNVSDNSVYPAEFQKALGKLASLQGRNYGELALMSSNLKDSMAGKAFDKRQAELRSVLTGRAGLRRLWAPGTAEIPSDLETLVNSPTLGVDLLPSLFSDKEQEVRDKALELFVRRVYRAHRIEGLEVRPLPGSESGVESVVMWQSRFKDVAPEKAPVRLGMMVVARNAQELEARMPAVLDFYADLVQRSEQADTDQPLNVLHFAIVEPDAADVGDRAGMDLDEKSKLVDQVEAVCCAQEARLRELSMRTVNAIVCLRERPPLHYTFTECLGYKEDPARRNMRPTFTHLLEMPRLSNYDLTRVPTINRDLHIYIGDAKQTMGKKKPQRLFLRRITHSTDFLEGSGADRILTKALDGLELAQRDPRVERSTPSAIFVNIMPWLPGETAVIADQCREALSQFVSANATRLLQMRVDEIEIKARTGEEGKPAPIRVMASSRSGQRLRIECFEEFPDPISGMSKHFCTLSPPQADGSPAEAPVCFVEPYTVSSDVENKRATARRVGTTYAYDFLGLFDKSLIQAWDAHVKSGACAVNDIPTDMFTAEELVMTDGGSLEKLSRPIGTNKVAMLAWETTLCTPECPEGRKMVLIASDVSVKSGSFGVEEDDFFYAASRYAADRGLPRIYIACNSGARIGLVEKLKPLIKVAWNNDQNPALGFEYLYLDDEDYKTIAPESVRAREVQGPDGQTRWALDDIIGTDHGIGVENLRGSGMIAGETSRAYTETFTLSYVTGRSVGIGAYLCRLGQRTIQMENGPLILTGYGALNKLLGRNVYTSQDQLGGPQIMIPNGVSHLEVKDDQAGVDAILKWLSYVPAKVGMLPPALNTQDPIDRTIDFKPSKTPYDPRHMLDGVYGADGAWTSGFLDKGSWTETLGGWGKTVVVGRGRLGGIPLGVIAVETRAVEQTVPADPANPASSEQLLAQAGQVWFPDSAFKTAQAIRDFNNGEELPLCIFANWRGFSGGTRDMYNEILKFGAMIVDELRAYRHPVFIYIPPGGELRGGAWVVVDPTINQDMMEMYADVEARGGILEPPGICEVKFRKADQIASMHRLDPVLQELDQDPQANKDAIKARETTLLPIYLQVAHEFADLHDRAGRMEAKGVIRSAIEWPSSREYFYWRLHRRLQEDSLRRLFTAEDSTLDHAALTQSLQDLAGDAYNSDQAFLKWVENSTEVIDAEISKVKKSSIHSQIRQLVANLSDADKEDLLAEL